MTQFDLNIPTYTTRSRWFLKDPATLHGFVLFCSYWVISEIYIVHRNTEVQDVTARSDQYIWSILIVSPTKKDKFVRIIDISLSLWYIVRSYDIKHTSFAT